VSKAATKTPGRPKGLVARAKGRRWQISKFLLRTMAALLFFALGGGFLGTLPLGQAQSFSIDVQVSKDNSSASSTVTSPAFSTTSSNELLLAFISSDAANSTTIPNTTVTAVTGGGLTWQLVQRTNVQLGTAEIWRAFARSKLTSAAVKATMSQSVASSLTVLSFIGADSSGLNGAGAIGAVGTGNSVSGAPTASIVTTRNNSWVFGVGNDWDNAISRTPGSNQSLVHQYLATVHDTYWVQKQTSAIAQSGTSVVLNDTAPTTDRYNLSIVEVLPAQAAPSHGPLSIDAQVSSDKTASSSNTTSSFSTTAANELLLAFISSDNTSTPNTTVTGITGGGLTWQLVQRTNVQLGTAEIWRAFATSQLSNATVAVSFSQSVANSVTIVGFLGADPSGTNGSGAIGAIGTGNANPGTPTASLVTTRNNSWVFGVGNDWDKALSRTVGTNQSLVHQNLSTVNDTYWVQGENLPTPASGTTVLLNDTAPATDRYNLSIIEVLPGLPPTITASLSPGPNANGWNKSAVTVTFQCTPGSFAIVSCPSPQIVSTQGANQQVSGTVTDQFGLTATVTANVSIDLTAPSLSITSPANGAIVASSPLTVTGTVSDALSGISSVTCNGVAATVQSGSFSCSMALVAGANSINVQASDVAGNTTSQSESVTFGTQPAITSFSPGSAPIGTLIAVSGSNFTANGATPQVTLNQQGGGTIPAPVSSASANSLSFVIPSGAATGPITVTVNGQSASSSSSLAVIASSTFTLNAAPGSAALLSGQTTTYQVSLASTNGFSQLAALSVTGVPAGVSASFQPQQIAAGQFSVLTLTAAAGQSSSSSQLTINASASVQGISESASATVTLNVQPAGGVAFAGRVAVTGDAYDTPLVGLTVRFTGLNYTGSSTGCTASTRTDASGNFQFSSLPEACAGSQLVQYDPSTVVAPAGKYSGVNLSYVLTPGQVTTPGIIVHLPRVDTAETVSVAQNSSTDQIFSFRTIPNLTIVVYAGTTLTLADGTQPNPFPLSVVEIPYDHLPEKMQPDPTQDPGFAMSIEPFNSRSSQPVAVFFPNRTNVPPGTIMPLTSLNPTLGIMVNYGTGTVSGDGSQIIPDLDPARPGHAYGIVHFDWHFPLPLPRNAVNQSPDQKVPKRGDPVDPASGLLVITKTDLAFGGARGQVAITRTYRSMSANPGPFGIGTNHNYGYMLDTSSVTNGQIGLVMPDGNQFSFVRQGDGAFTNTANPSLRGVIIDNLTCVGPQARPQSCGATLRWKNGTKYQFQPMTNGFAGAMLASITDSNNNTTTLVRSQSVPMEITQITDPVGRSLNLSYDSSFRITSISDPIGRLVRYTYNPQGRLATVTDAAGGVTSYGYDAQARLTSITDPRGITYLQNEYDQNGRVMKQTTADGGVTTFSYTLFNSVVSTTVTQSAASFAATGGNAVVGSAPIPNTNTSPVVLTTVTDPLGNQTTYHFNSVGFLLDITDALGQKTVYNVDPGTNQTASVVDPLGRVTAFAYDSAGNPLTITRLAGTASAVTTSFTYEPNFNKVASITDPLGHTTSFFYHDGNLTKTTDSLGNQAILTYDVNGELITAADPIGNATQFSYQNGDLVKTTDPLGRVWTQSSDSVGRVISNTNPLGQTTLRQYSPLNLVSQSVDPSGQQTLFQYDSNGNLVSATDALGHTTMYVYDSMDRLSSRTDPLGHAEGYEYDLNGYLKQFTDRRGISTNFTYDALSRRIQATFGNESSISYSYDGGGRLTRTIDSATGPISRLHDGLDRLTLEVTPEGRVAYSYDTAGRRASMALSGQTPVTYSYDNADRLINVTQGSSIVTLVYDTDGRRTSVALPNGVLMGYGYDPASQLTGINYTLGSNTIGNLTYSYDLSGQRSSVGGTFARTGEPAAIANASYNSSNQLTQFGNSSLSSDANGNLTSDGLNTYRWNARNQLAGIRGSVSADFQYDPFGRRVTKAAASTTSYLYDGASVAQESSANGSINLLAGGIDEVFSRTDQSGASNFLVDAEGNTVALTGSTGNILSQYTYEPFGNSTVSGNSSNPYQYTGRENDGTGLLFYRARYYSPTFQRFISEDPWGFAGGLNFYSYASNNPINFVDPWGEQPCSTLIDAQNAAMDNDDFQEHNGKTHCNQATLSIIQAVGAPDGGLTNGDGSAVDANTMAQTLANSADYQHVSPEQAQAIANGGGLAIAAYQNPRGHGHVATVRTLGVPGDNPPAGRGPLLNNIGPDAFTGIVPQSGALSPDKVVNYYSPSLGGRKDCQ